jgi:hypothetical protein
MSTFLEQLAEARGNPSPGYNPMQFIELVDGEQILYQFYEPDAETCRNPYYYNTRENVLYKQRKVVSPISNRMTYYWQPISDL